MQVSKSAIILTGGSSGGPSVSLVTEHSGLDTEEVVTRELPSLNRRRYNHACAAYSLADKKVKKGEKHIFLESYKQALAESLNDT